MTKGDAHLLGDLVAASLAGPHAHLAGRRGRVATYADGVATFSAVPTDARAEDWIDLAALLGPGGFADLFSAEVQPPEDWEPVFDFPGLQLVEPGRPTVVAADPRVVPLGPADVEGMLDLVAATRPGPFWRRTIEMGTYLGVRDGDRLVAMAGTRLNPPGWREVSAVCTAPEARGRGLAATLVRHLAHRIQVNGERPFLHVGADNAAALDLYERLGWSARRTVRFHGYRVPG